MVSEAQILWDWMPFSPPSVPSLVLTGTARFADGLDAADLENGVGAIRVGCSPYGHFMPQMPGEAFRREAVRHQIRDQISGLIVDEHVLSILFIHAAG